MSLISVEALSSIDELPTAAAELTDRYVEKNPFVSRMWLRAYEKELLKSNESALYLIVSSGRVPQIVVPMIIEKLNIFRIEKLRSMSNFYTNVYSVITAPQIEQDEIQLADCVNALVGHIADKYRRIPIIELSPLRGNCAFYSLLALSLEQHGYGTRRYFVTANWHETFDSTPDFDEYLKKRPGTLRNTLKRKLRILNRETNHRIDINKTEQAVKAAIKDFEIVYEQSWKPEESYPCFIASIVRQLAARGKAMVGVLYVDEEPAAAQIWIEIGDHWAVFKLAYRPQFSKYSVGSVLTARMIEECLALPGTRCIDFLSGDDGYKADWVSKKAAHWGVEAINRSNPWGRLLSLKRRFGPANDTIDANLAAAAM